MKQRKESPEKPTASFTFKTAPNKVCIGETQEVGGAKVQVGKSEEGTHEAKAEMLVRSSVHSVFDAFVNPGTIVQFWLEGTSGPLAPGATVTWKFMVPGAEETVKVTEFAAPGHLAFDWSDGIHVDMRFTSQGAGDASASIVRVIADGFKEPAQALDATEGFTIVLCDLKTLLESGVSANLVRDKAALIAQSR